MDPFSPFRATPHKEEKASEYKDTIVTFLLDESGSMQDCFGATVSGFNEYVNSLKRDKHGKCNFTLIKFEGGNVLVPCDNVPVEKVPELNASNYRPGGGTPLHDAIMDAIQRTEKAVGGNKDMNVILVIQTDGQENASKRFKLADIHAAVQGHQKQGWVFVFLGADIDAYAASHQYGIGANNTVSYGKANTESVFAVMASNTSSYRSTGMASTMNFADDQKTLMGDPTAKGKRSDSTTKA